MIDPLLVDECLTPDLAAYANSRGHYATHVVFRGLQGTLDHELMPVIIENGFVFVTNNARDFLKLYSRQPVHPGLVIIVPGNLNAKRQTELFALAIAELERAPDLVNKVLEVFDDGRLAIRDLP